MGQEKGRSLGIPLDQFCDQAYDGLTKGHDQVIIGSIGPRDNSLDIVDKPRGAFGFLAKLIRRESYHSSDITLLGGTGWCRAYVVERHSTLLRVFCTMGSRRGPIPLEYGLVPNVESHTTPVTPRFSGYGLMPNVERHTTILRECCTMGSLRGPISYKYGVLPTVEGHTTAVTPAFLGYGNLERHSILLVVRVGVERRAPQPYSGGTVWCRT